MQALKQVPKQDFEIDLIDDNRQTLIEQERVRERCAVESVLIQ